VQIMDGIHRDDCARLSGSELCLCSGYQHARDTRSQFPPPNRCPEMAFEAMGCLVAFLSTIGVIAWVPAGGSAFISNLA